jgi:phosphoribosylformylglycinamidine cyclo-ligase
VDELLEPCAIHTPDVLALARDGLLHAAAHITGGGFTENIPRALPEGLAPVIDRGSWPEPPIFELVRSAAGASDEDMFATFNMGIGMVLVADPADADEILERCAGRAHRIGRVDRG